VHAVVVHTIIPAVWEVDDHGLRPAQAKVSKTQSYQTSQVYWCTPVIQAMWEIEVGRLLSESGPGQKA
jgi:hypothetical protein